MIFKTKVKAKPQALFERVFGAWLTDLYFDFLTYVASTELEKMKKFFTLIFLWRLK
jgi:hypothetical protein